MSICDRVRPLLPLYCGGDLLDGESSAVAEHLASCLACSTEAIEYKVLVASARMTPPSQGMPAALRRRIAEEAAANARRSRWRALLPPFVQGIPAMRLAGAMAAAALLAAVVLPVALRDSRKGLPNQAVTRIDVVRDGGVVRLAWSDGRKETYTVYKSHNPREFSAEEAHVVRGNVWTDESPETSQVVFYRIE
jgi:anti-sigma factor RsiW